MNLHRVAQKPVNCFAKGTVRYKIHYYFANESKQSAQNRILPVRFERTDVSEKRSASIIRVAS
jgi:hypothetical protein